MLSYPGHFDYKNIYKQIDLMGYRIALRYWKKIARFPSSSSFLDARIGLESTDHNSISLQIYLLQKRLRGVTKNYFH